MRAVGLLRYIRYCAPGAPFAVQERPLKPRMTRSAKNPMTRSLLAWAIRHERTSPVNLGGIIRSILTVLRAQSGCRGRHDPILVISRVALPRPAFRG